MSKITTKSHLETEKLTKNVFDRPDFLDNMNFRGERARRIAFLGAQLKSLSNSKCVAYTINEYMDRFAIKDGEIKKATFYIKAQLKKVHGIKNCRIHIEDDRVYIWTTGIKK